MSSNNSCGAYVFRDKDENRLKLFVYAEDDSSKNKFSIVIFQNEKVYTAESSCEGINRFIADEDMHCIQTNTFEELQGKIPNFTKKDYENMVTVVNSKIDLLPVSQESCKKENNSLTNET
jgi:uncharacterized protein YneR